MKYSKPTLTFQQQADLLLRRGLVADREELIARLKVVSYYRLSGYWYPFRNPDDTLQSGTTLDRVWQRYTFDRQLRLLVLDAVDRVEIAVRTSLVYHHCHTYGPFGYLNGSSLPHLDKNDFTLLQGKLRGAMKQSREAFVVHFQRKYGDAHSDLPLWMAAELMSLGMVFTLFRGAEKRIKRGISAEFEIAFGVMGSWLASLNAIRNICAHHGRLWNRVLGVKPLIPAKNPEWHSPVEVCNDRMFGVLTLLRYMLAIIAPQSKWQDRLEVLIAKYPGIPLGQMGFAQNWRDCPIWR